MPDERVAAEHPENKTGRAPEQGDTFGSPTAYSPTVG